MPAKFEIPDIYRSELVSSLKQVRLAEDPKKQDFSPTVLDLGPLQFKLARHFGFCFGVEHAISLAYRVLDENPGHKAYLLSEIIHNPEVNSDLLSKGVSFLLAADGKRLLDFSSLSADDVVIIPAFGTTCELISELEGYGVTPLKYDGTCPFVKKVWKRAEQLGAQGFTVVIHGKTTHEETKATFSHSSKWPTVVVRDLGDAQFVCSAIRGNCSSAQFTEHFSESLSSGFNPLVHLQSVGVVNQTTMLAPETEAIAQVFRETMREVYGEESLSQHFAETKDTLCSATYENQKAALALIQSGADLALVLGGYNSSNTSHLVELCAKTLPTFLIKDENEILSKERIRHFDLSLKQALTTDHWLPQHSPVEFAVTAGASCPDRVVDAVLKKVSSFFPDAVWPTRVR